jgi:hypothetical protein
VSKAEKIIGLTPMIKRIAYYYLRLGEGEYVPDGGTHPHYNRIVVRELYEFKENPRVSGEHSGGMIVEFFKDKRRVRWVEFRCQVVGGGGEVIIRRVK